jgi:hypothetical protein
MKSETQIRDNYAKKPVKMPKTSKPVIKPTSELPFRSIRGKISSNFLNVGKISKKDPINLKTNHNDIYNKAQSP